MKPLDDSDRERYRLDLLGQVLRERYPRIPWAEKHRNPMPLDDSAAKIAERVRILDRAMSDENGKVVQLKRKQRAA